MGVVYLATDPEGMAVAVKVIHRVHSRNREFVTRFRREVDAARRVPRFCTAAVLDADLTAEEPFIVTEYVDGPSLYDAVADDGPLTGADLNALAVGMAAALTAIHDAGVVHRDLKPSNVLLSSAGARVIDFGIARAVDATSHTLTGQVLGTPGYMAPEQISGDEATSAADVFAWGGVVVYAAGGQPPFGQPSSIAALLHRVLTEEPRLGALEPGLRSVVAAAMDKDPRRRPSAKAILDRLLVLTRTSGAAGASQAATVLGQASVPLPAALPTTPPPTTPPSTTPPMTSLPPARPLAAAPPPPTTPPHAAPTIGPGDPDRTGVSTLGEPGRRVAGSPPHRRAAVAVAVAAVAAVLAVVAAVVVLDPFGVRATGGKDPEVGASGTTSGGTTGAAAAVPFDDVIGRNAADLEAELSVNDVEVRMVDRESAHEDLGNVLDSEPAPGSTVMAGDTVTLYVGDGSVATADGRLVYKRIDDTNQFENIASIVVTEPNGKEKIIGAGDSPDISADGKVVSYLSHDQNWAAQVWVTGPSGKNPRKVTDVTVGSVQAAALSPDGTQVAYSNNTGGIYVIGVDGSGRRQVSDAEAFELDWSPDGRQIVFRRWDVTPQELWVVGADGSGARGLDIGLTGDAIPANPSWSPDGALIAFDDFAGNVYVIGPDGRSQRQVTSGSYPTWTPDGDLVVVRPSAGQVVTLAPDGTGEQVLNGVGPANGPVQWGDS